MTNHHEAAEQNLTAVFRDAAHTHGKTRTVEQAQAAYTERLAAATIANAQALLAINETLMAIHDHLTNPDPR